MTRKMRNQYRASALPFCLNNFFGIVGFVNSFDCTVDYAGFMDNSVFIAKDKPTHTINHLHIKTGFFLCFVFILKCLFYSLHHRNSTNPGFCLWRRNMKFTLSILHYSIDSRMVYTNGFILIIQIFPTQPYHFSYATSRSKKCCKQWQPMAIHRTVRYIIQKCSLLFQCKCVSYALILSIRLFDFCHYTACRIIAYHIVPNCHLKGWVQNRMNIIQCIRL